MILLAHFAQTQARCEVNQRSQLQGFRIQDRKRTCRGSFSFTTQNNSSALCGTAYRLEGTHTAPSVLRDLLLFIRSGCSRRHSSRPFAVTMTRYRTDRPLPQPRRISLSMRALSTDTLSHLRNPRRPCRMGIPVRSPGVGRRHRESGANG